MALAPHLLLLADALASAQTSFGVIPGRGSLAVRCHAGSGDYHCTFTIAFAWVPGRVLPTSLLTLNPLNQTSTFGWVVKHVSTVSEIYICQQTLAQAQSV